MQFTDRLEAGRQLAPALAHHRDREVVVLGVPRGGVPVAFEVALALEAPLDVVVVRALLLPGHRDVAMGAVGEGGLLVTNDDVLTEGGVRFGALGAAVARERTSLRRQVSRFRASAPLQNIAGRVVVIVDEGVSTGATARAACLVARARGAAEVVLATPVADAEALPSLQEFFDEVVCLSAPDSFWTVAESYRDFEQVSDAEVLALLTRPPVITRW